MLRCSFTTYSYTQKYFIWHRLQNNPNVHAISGLYTERVLEAVRLLGIEVMPNFAGKAETAVDALRGDGQSPNIDENEFIDASRLVYDGVIIIFCLHLKIPSHEQYRSIEITSVEFRSIRRKYEIRV